MCIQITKVEYVVRIDVVQVSRFNLDINKDACMGINTNLDGITSYDFNIDAH